SRSLTWRSDAPRSTAALMIFSMVGELVPGVLIDDVPQGFPAQVSAPVVEKQIELAGPEPARRYRRDVRREENLWNLPERTRQRQWLAAKYVEYRAAQATIAKAFDDRVVVEHRSARHIDDDGRPRQQV